jgi:hypothetical protein
MLEKIKGHWQIKEAITTLNIILYLSCRLVKDLLCVLGDLRGEWIQGFGP